MVVFLNNLKKIVFMALTLLQIMRSRLNYASGQWALTLSKNLTTFFYAIPHFLSCLSMAFCFFATIFSDTQQHFIHMEYMDIEQTPQYLYKILSLRHWHATQNQHNVVLPGSDEAFIHLATEDQVERIIAKFWADAPQVVILKIDVQKLIGRLVFESNPGGSTRYYHLYNGFIPLQSILESTCIYRQPMGAERSLKLDIVQVGHPVLRTVARELSIEEILSSEVQSLIEDMKQTMRMAPGVGLAAPQIGKSLQIAVIEDMDHTHLTTEQIKERDRGKVPFHVIINPHMHVEQMEMVEFFEGCLSIPGFVGLVPRAKQVRVECLNEHAQPITIRATGWYARILQHEIDHLHATLYMDRAKVGTIMTQDNYIQFWKSKSSQEVSEALVKR